MESCKDPFCRGPVLEVAPGLFKCMICEQYYGGSPTGPPPRLEVVATLQTLTAHEAGVEVTAGEAEGMSGDMFIFVNRVAEGIIPTEGYDADTIKQLKKNQDNIRRELMNVLEGKGEFNDWFNRTKTALGLNTQDFMRLLADSLGGLRSEEALELKAVYEKALEKSAIG